MRELTGKGWRVLGYFVWMLGAGVLLDSNATTAAGLLLFAGASMFTLGTAQSLLRASASTPRASGVDAVGSRADERAKGAGS